MKILTINSGSSSVKFSVYVIDSSSETLSVNGAVNGIGSKEGVFCTRRPGRDALMARGGFINHEAAIERIFDWLEGYSPGIAIDAVGHRIVHGGTIYRSPEVVTGQLLSALRSLIPLAPNHLPHEIMAIEATNRILPNITQVSCFDTAFHGNMPAIAKTYALPKDLRDEGIVKYGFHGLSYEYIIDELIMEGGADEASGRIIIAHLGHGSSMAAVMDGRCVDTTMGFTPCGGLVMSTRTGDLDPGVILYLMTRKGMSGPEITELVYKRAGLLGLSGYSPEMKELLERAEIDPAAKEAIDIFCYCARKHIGSLSAAMGGLDTLIFTGGIGENSSRIRSGICTGLGFFGVDLDEESNRKNLPVISKTGGKVTVRVIRTDEELMVARHTYKAAAMK